MYLLASDHDLLTFERDERLRRAGLLPSTNPRRTSFEVLRDVRLRRRSAYLR